MNMTIFNNIEKLLNLGHTYESIKVITGYSIEEIKKVDNWRKRVKQKEG